LNFLTVAEGARHLGLTGLRLREAALRGQIPSQQDNEGRLRVDLTGVEALPELGADAAPLDPGALMGLLFDEIEDLQADQAAKDSQIAALSDLVVRQGAALEKAGDVLARPASGPVGRQGELIALLDRAMEHLEAQAVEGETGRRLQVTANRAMALLERALKRAGDVQVQADVQTKALESDLETMRAQLEHTLALSERVLEARAGASRQVPENTQAKPGFWARIFGR
jgi:hypothetical protein